jgi:hypothetical protein
LKFSSFDYRNVSGVQLHLGMITGSAVVDVAGAAPVGSSYWGNGNTDSRKAQNAIRVTKGSRPGPDAAKVRELITNWHNRQDAAAGTPAVTATDGSDVLDQIKKLGELRDAGLLTADEFEAKKTDLLGRL